MTWRESPIDQAQGVADHVAKTAADPPPEGYVWSLAYNGAGQRMPHLDQLVRLPFVPPWPELFGEQ